MDSISYAKNKEEECLNVSITIHTPRKLIHKHPTVFAISLLLFFVGVLLGFKPEYSQEVLEKVREQHIEPTAVAVNVKSILLNNGLIAFVLWGGWFPALFLDLSYLPPAVMVYSVGIAFGTVFSTSSPINSVLTFASFGLIEALSFLMACSGGLLFIKYIVLKISRSPVSFIEILKDAATFLVYSMIFLFTSSVLEAFLINPSTTMLSVLAGIAITVAIVYWLISPSSLVHTES